MNKILLQRYGATLILAAAALFHGFNTNAGHSWGDDFAQYLLHARNLISGKPYDKTGYLVNSVDPARLDVGPSVYPPLTPVMLAPIYKFSGLSFRAFKYEQTIFLVLAAAAILLYFRRARDVSMLCGLALIAGVAFHPWLWQAKEYIGSDLLFLALCFLSLWFLELLFAAENWANARWLTILTGFSVYLTLATRTVGIVLLLTAFVMVLPRWRKRWPVFLAVGLAGTLWLLQSQLLPEDKTYTEYLFSRASPERSIRNIIDYAREFSGVWSNSYSLPFARLLFVASLPAALLGGYKKVRTSIAAIDVFSIGYIAAIIIWPSVQGFRFLLPLLPVYLYYLLVGLEQIHKRGPYVIAAILAFSYAANYAGRSYVNPEDGVLHPDFLALSRFVQRSTNPDDVFLFRKPRALALVANRPSTVYNSDGDDGSTWRLILNLKVHYIAVADLPNEDFATDQTVLKPFVERFPDSFAQVYENSHFVLFRVLKVQAGPSTVK